MGTTSYSSMVTAIKKLKIGMINDLVNLEPLRIKQDGSISCFYIPFDYITKNAKVVFVGINTHY
jgi:hypothetical protein